jgi:hypothetical protein
VHANHAPPSEHAILRARARKAPLLAVHSISCAERQRDLGYISDLGVQPLRVRVSVQWLFPINFNAFNASISFRLIA